MTRRALLLLCIVVAAGCRDEAHVPAPPPAEAPSTPQTRSQAPSADTSSEEEVRTLIRNLGSKLQLVSLLAPPDAGTPGRIDAATGSRYVEIPIEITATTTAGKTQHFRGHYVLRRSVVDGATAEQRQWRIASAKISRITG